MKQDTTQYAILFAEDADGNNPNYAEEFVYGRREAFELARYYVTNEEEGFRKLYVYEVVQDDDGYDVADTEHDPIALFTREGYFS